MSDQSVVSGDHYDDDKVRLDLLPGGPLWAIGEVFTYGAKKYSDRNWENGIKMNRLFGSVMRHLWSWWRGETIDPESGFNHLAHAGCNIMMMLDLSMRGRTDLDNRPKEVQP